MRVLPNYLSACLSEFEGYTGDCTQVAHQSARHCINPASYPMTAAALNALVAADVAHGFAGATGSQSDVGLANSLRTFDPTFPFHQIFDSAWQGELATWGGKKPIIFQVSNGQALHGDEAGLHGHAIHCLGWDPVAHTGLFCDGDNAAPNAPVSYTLQDLINAAPFAVTIIDLDLSAQGGAPLMLDISQVGTYFAAQADGSWKCQNGNVLATGMLQTYRDIPALGTLAGLTLLGLPLTNILYQPEGGCAVQVFERGILVWDPVQASGVRKIDNPPGVTGDYYLLHWNNARNPLWQAVQDQLAAETAKEKADAATIASLQAQLAAGTIPDSLRAAIAALDPALAPLAQALAAVKAVEGALPPKA